MAVTAYKLPDGRDLSEGLVPKSYLIDRYPELVDGLRQSGLWGWGINTEGELGDNTNVSTGKSSPIQTIAGGTNWKQISFAYSNIAGIKTDGTLWGWGYNVSGSLGVNQTTTLYFSSPVQTIAGGTNWKQCTTGSGQTAAIKTDGTLWLWGRNSYGQLGDNTIVSKSSPMQTIAGGTNWKLVSHGGGNNSYLFAIKTDGTLWGWGYNTTGQLGDNTIVRKSSPVQTVAGGTNWRTISCSWSHNLAIKTDGTLWSWGLGTSGQLGDNTIVSKSSPVQTVSGGTNWKQVAASNATSAALKIDGTLWTWGNNSAGELGNNLVGASTNVSSPIQTISGGTNWKQVSANQGGGASGTAMGAIKTDGTLWMWGYNLNGALGILLTQQRSSPVQTVAGGTNWKFINATGYTSFALRDDSADEYGNYI